MENVKGGLLNILFFVSLAITYGCYLLGTLLLSALFKRLDMPGIIAILPIAYAFLKSVSIVGIVIALIFIYYMAIAMFKIAEEFGKGKVYAIGMLLLPFIFIPILGYSKD